MQSHEVHDVVAASRSLSLPMPSKMQMPIGSIAEERGVARKISVTLVAGTRLVIYEMPVVAPRYAKRHIVSEGGNVLHQCQTRRPAHNTGSVPDLSTANTLVKDTPSKQR